MHLIKNRHLLTQFTKRHIQIQYRGSYMGSLWTLLNPLLMLLIYSYVFGFIYGGSFDVVEDETPYQHAAAILLGITIFGYFADVLALAPSAISANPNFVKKVVFPLEVLPSAIVFHALFNALIKFFFSVVLIIFFCDGSPTEFLLLPLILIPMFLSGMGLALTLSSISIYIKDIVNFVGFLSMALLFSSAVFYGSNMIPEAGWTVLKFNPLIHFIEWSRYTFLWKTGQNPGNLYFLYGISIATYLIGVYIYKRLKESFADVI